MIDKMKMKSAFVTLLFGSVVLSLHITLVVLKMHSSSTAGLDILK